MALSKSLRASLRSSSTPGKSRPGSIMSALLHDCGREVASKDSVAKCQELGLPIDAIEMHQPILLHAKLGVYNAMHKYGVADQEILDGIMYHTTGIDGMSKLAKVVYLADMISGLMDFDRFGVLTEEGLPPEEIRELIHIAHEEGFAVMAHANGARTAEAAAKAGIDSIEHGAYLDGDALCAMKENGTVWVPTLSTIGNLRGKGRFHEDAVQAILESALENVSAFARMGGLVALGSDAGAWAVPHGSLSEQQLLEQVGVDPTPGNKVIMEKF